MKCWPDEKILNVLGIELPIIQAPMAGVDTPELAVAVSQAGGLGSLACAMLSPDQIRSAWHKMRAQTDKPINLNFFCHDQKEKSEIQQAQWKNRLAPYYRECGINPDAVVPSAARVPFDENYCALIEELKPSVVSFHFGLPSQSLLDRVKAVGAVILSSATTREEAIWLEQNGCDVVIAQGAEAGGHRAMFLTADLKTQIGTADLVSQIVDAVSLPVIAAGGISGARAVRDAFSWGASAVQLGTAYLFCPEAKAPPLYREALRSDAETVITNVYSGRPARGILNRFINEVGPISPDAPDFPYASHFVAPLRTASERAARTDFIQMWSGTVRAAHNMDAEQFTRMLADETLALL